MPEALSPLLEKIKKGFALCACYYHASVQESSNSNVEVTKISKSNFVNQYS